MSKCITLADEAIDQKDTCTGLTARDIVDFILDEVLLSAVIVSDKGCSRIGDFNINEDFCQQFDQQLPSYLKDFETSSIPFSQNPSPASQEFSLNSGENVDRSIGLLNAKENIDIILDNIVKKDEKAKSINECKVITEEVLADNELQIQNGQTHLERNKSEYLNKSLLEAARHEYFKKEDVIKDEKIEIEYFNDGKINKIYVPLSNAPSTDALVNQDEVKGLLSQENLKTNVTSNVTEEEGKVKEKCDDEKEKNKPFRQFTTEELRQVWNNGNTVIKGWEGDMSTQPEDVVRLMKELSSVNAFPSSVDDPNRPRACSVAEEDVKKMIKEIEEINFNQAHGNLNQFDMACHPDGQGDADLESKSFNSRDAIAKSLMESNCTLNVNPSNTSTKTTSEKSSQHRREMEKCPVMPVPNMVEEGEDLNLNFDKEEEIFSSKIEGYDSPRFAKGFAVKFDRFDDDIPKGLTIEQYEYNSLRTNSIENLIKNDIYVKNINFPSPTAPAENIAEELNRSFELKPEECLLVSESYNEGTPKRVESKPTCTEANSVQSREIAYSLLSSASYVISRGRNSDTFRNTEPVIQDKKVFADESNHPVNSSEESNQGLIFSPGSMSFSEAITSYQSICNEPKVYTYDLDFKPERDTKLFSEKPSEIMGEVHSFSDTAQDRCFSEVFKRDSIIENFEPICQQSENSDVTPQQNRICFDSANNGMNLNVSQEIFSKTKKQLNETSSDIETKEKSEHRGSEPKLSESNIYQEQSNKEVSERGSTASDPNTRKSSESSKSQITEKNSKEDTKSDFPDSANLLQTFRLHSKKMYSGATYKSDNHRTNDLILTDSEEAFIDTTENVIQIIDPPDNSADEDSAKISFSLFNENKHHFSSQQENKNNESESDTSVTSNDGNSNRKKDDSEKKKVYSGMTTIGPIKNVDYDPKDLTGPDIDYGRMTHITSSRQLAKDIFGSELKAIPSMRIIEGSFDEDASLTMDDRIELGSLVNRDIASLTKVQKVREVMSHQPKPEEDFDDDDALPRPRLDLKDVESMTDERYKVPDVSIPLLSFEVGDGTTESEKDYMTSMQLMISGNCFNNAAYYEQDNADSNMEIEKNFPSEKNNASVDGSTALDQVTTKPISSKNIGEVKSEKENDGISSEAKYSKHNEVKNRKSKVLKADSCDIQSDDDPTVQKYGTLSSVFKKASHKFIRKDGDLVISNSKSLPRDAAKLTTSDSIRSILDDCHSSATNVLKKSRSLLKNTQSIFKTLSQTRFNLHDSNSNLEKHKQSPSESDINNVERKFSSLLRKEDFTKAKNLIKSKVEKTFKNSESVSSPRSESEVTPEKADLGEVKNEENSRTENLRKLLPKSHLVYKSQFVKSQISVPNNTPENLEDQPQDLQIGAKEDSKILTADKGSQRNSKDNLDETESPRLAEAESEKEIAASYEGEPIREKMTWINERDVQQVVQCEPPQPDYIVMETVPGLPTGDIDNCNYEIEKSESKIVRTTNSEDKKWVPENKAETLNTTQETVNSDLNNITSPRLSEKDEEKAVTKSPTDKKGRKKNKKFAARFRSFWCSTFGRVKTPPKKTDIS